LWNDRVCSPKTTAYSSRSSPTVIRRSSLTFWPTFNIAHRRLSLAVNQVGGWGGDAIRAREGREFKACWRGIRQILDVGNIGDNAAMQPKNPAGEDARDLVQPFVRRHVRRLGRIKAQLTCPENPEPVRMRVFGVQGTQEALDEAEEARSGRDHPEVA